MILPHISQVILRFFSRCTVHIWLFNNACNWYFLWQIWHSNSGSELTCFVNKWRVMASLLGYSWWQKWHIKCCKPCFRLCCTNIARVVKLLLHRSHLWWNKNQRIKKIYNWKFSERKIRNILESFGI